jgi:hypothetical protein
VMDAFCNYGPSLREDICKLSPEDQLLAQRRLDTILKEHDRVWLRTKWLSSLQSKDKEIDLEWFLATLSEFLDERNHGGSLSRMLDCLAVDYRRTATPRDPVSLARFLFGPEGLKGASPEDYLRPENCNLRQVIERKVGIPISLTSIFMLVGKRAGIQVRGFNFPGHFLAIARVRNTRVVIDCFNGGKLLPSADSVESGEPYPFSTRDLRNLECTDREILLRYLRNLSNSFHHLGEVENERFFSGLLAATYRPE